MNPEGIIATQSSNKTFLIGIDNKMVFTLLPILGISIFYIEKFLPSRNRKEILRLPRLYLHQAFWQHGRQMV